MENFKDKREENLEQNKEFTIIVNAREKMWVEKLIFFEQLVILAFGQLENTQSTAYTVTYSRGNENKPEGSLVIKESVLVKNKMIFNVTQTTRS